MRNYRLIKQINEMGCGRACLKMICLAFGVDKSVQVDESLELSEEGNSLYDLSVASDKLNLVSKVVKLSIEELLEVNHPCILHWSNNHFVVLYKINKRKAVIADPAHQIETFNLTDFSKYWLDKDQRGYVILFLPNNKFFEEISEKTDNHIFRNILGYLKNFKFLFFQLFIGFVVGSVIQLIFPFLMQNIVDKGILLSDISFIKIILFSQLALILGKVSIEFIRSWILMHISIRVNIFILNDFFAKVFKLPVKYFETRTKGDFLQRLDDQKRIESFFTNQVIGIIFSLLNLVIYSILVLYYNQDIFLVFLGFTVVYTLWTLSFLPKRKKLDTLRFQSGSEIQSNTLQLIEGLKDIKLYNIERKKRWEWEDLRANLFLFNIKNLNLNQWQQGGATFINESKNIIITFLCAKLVIEGTISLGVLLSIQYILGQLNNPIQQFISFIQAYQDAKLSIQRLNEMYDVPDEVDNNKRYDQGYKDFKEIKFENVSYKVGGKIILDNVSFRAKRNTVTAIVGESGGGKTSILKLLLNHIQPTFGEINIGNSDLKQINIVDWRKNLSATMQDSYLFSQSILDNICLTEEAIDYKRFYEALKLAKLDEFVASLPNKEGTILENNGTNVSQGQKQRILIARAIYKNTHIIIFDEATNALDTNTEFFMLENLKTLFQNKTVFIVAHRLNTIRNADNIIVIKNGTLVEQGNHHDLIASKRDYYQLVENQL
ncbi:peptidase domain-containing ABC transporter [Sphingobacterium kitahiroshimense]|uniref:peptidase domain-containing ABC transporter n=1 Tax=Sphingobacterium sp. B16(2022) TaxID=2914044 RepID=UPI001438D8DF|nr:peptidase domain-containing ABC transporter [Sphingobacterium sp. B16(2022)]NJI73230.1 peptidase domain-containing ABC transporter [Sphingobacterium sp. B16(2022)]